MYEMSITSVFGLGFGLSPPSVRATADGLETTFKTVRETPGAFDTVNVTPSMVSGRPYGALACAVRVVALTDVGPKLTAIESAVALSLTVMLVSSSMNGWPGAVTRRR